MARKRSKRPTDAELEILQVIWGRGPSTVREVLQEMSHSREIGYSTVLKLMQIMTEKGQLHRDESVRPQVYRTARTRDQTQQQLLGDLLDRAFSGSPGNLVVQALSSTTTTPEERRRIRELLDQLEES
ncbi:MAG: BlaI/MecI/CopY family transcriptional regulator [Planctomycetota bacterium]|jgi:predicted transcriptional regulator